MTSGIFSFLKRIIFPILLFTSNYVFPQQKDSSYKIVISGAQYNTSRLHQKLWGRHYRTEWNTPVNVGLFYLDTANGGLKPYGAGGGRQSKTLRLHDTLHREYVLRSIDKSFGKALPEIYQNTFIEAILNDQVSTAHPFLAVTIAPMAEAAKIYHTWPQLVYVPEQKGLDSFGNKFGNGLYLFEQRPDENWEDASNFGNSKRLISTEKLLKEIKEDGVHRVDQRAFIRARLFDFFIGDWGRHEDQWRWATFEKDNKTIYKPVPRDRDQAYTKFDGFLVKVLKSAAGAGYLQSFDYTIKDIRTLNYPARNLDRQLANETNLQQWVETAKELQEALTDEVITSSIKLLPPELLSVSGADLIAKLKTRRNDLPKYATEYYTFLAKEVDITGSKERDRFKLTGLPDGNLMVEIYEKKDSGGITGQPFYTRTFLASETKEVRLYGLDDKDEYEVSGEVSPITIRLIGGQAEDEYKITAPLKLRIYDDKSQPLNNTGGAQIHLSNDSLIHQFKYDAFQYSEKGLSPSVFYSDDDRIYLGLAYKITTQHWRKEPYAQKHILYAHYSVSQKAFSFGYSGIYNQVFGDWRTVLIANYDLVKWRNFFGLGNETVRVTNNTDYYRMRSTEGLLAVSLEHAIGKQSRVAITPFYQYIKFLRDDDRYLAKQYLNGSGGYNFTGNNFGGARAELTIQRINNLVLPTKGVTFSTLVTAAKNLAEEKSFINYAGNLRFYLPLVKHVVLSVENGAATVTGQPEFYQLNSIGGSSLRGYRSDRFFGETVFHNNNELQYLFNVRSHWFNGTLGLLGFADEGRVWKSGEVSNTWHYGYGGGIIAVPFNKLYVSLQYGISKEYSSFYLEFRTSL